MTAWERVLDRIGPDGEVSFEIALEAFSIAVGPLPGVPKPQGSTTIVASRTGAIRWLGGYRSRLTDEQRTPNRRRDQARPNTNPGHLTIRHVHESIERRFGRGGDRNQ